MLDPDVATVMFALGAVVTGVVIFGGATLAYFLDQRRIDPPKPVRVRHLQSRAKKNVATGEQSDGSHHEAA